MMGKVSINAGHAPCRGCGKAAGRAPVQRMPAGRPFGPAAETDAAPPRPRFGHDFARVSVRHGGEAAGEDAG